MTIAWPAAHGRHTLVAGLLALVLVLAAAGARAHGDAASAPSMPHPGGAAAEQTDYGRAGDPRRVQRTVRIGMTDAMRYTPARLRVRHGETVRFVVANHGRLPHELVLGSARAIDAHAALMQRFPEMEHADPNMTHVAPQASGEIVWHFNRRGSFRYACLQPGHYEAGMVGTVVVE